MMARTTAMGLWLGLMPWGAMRAADLTGPPAGMDLWYRQAAAEWLEAMPLGNGWMGAMVFGRLGEERIALNEGTFWSGRPHDYNKPDAHQYFGTIRDLVFDGKFQEAEQLANAQFYGVPAAQQAFQPLGDLVLTFPDGATTAYLRGLDLESGVATTRYQQDGVVFTREVFLSHPDRVLVVRTTADKPGRVSLRAGLKGPYLEQVTAKDHELTGEGCWKGPIPVNNWLIAPVSGKGIRFRTQLVARAEGGAVEAADGRLSIKGADAVTLMLAAATSYVNYRDISGDPAARCEQIHAAAAGKDYAALRARHEQDFRKLMERVCLKTGDEAMRAVPTDERLKSLRAGKRDTHLEALCFQFGRYLLASSSRAGGQPANLQGIWNESVSPMWGSKYTININTEMNYWPAEVCNLSECHQPLFDMLEDVAVTGAKTARTYYDCRGWVAHHNIDLWRGTAPVDAAMYGMWPVGGAWLCQHLWEHYQYTGDKEFLKRYYPVLRGAAEFLLELMVEHPEHRWLVTPFSMSPEHGYFDSTGKMAFLSPAPTLDVAIIRELFPHTIDAARVLETDAALRENLAAALKRLPPYRINRLGHLQEWIEDWKAGGQGHNVSPNFTIFPGSSVTMRGTPALAGAIGKWMDGRKPGGGWPGAWDTCVWARLERGDQVDRWVQTFVGKSLANNLHNRGSNQSDASYGFSAAIAESLLQSHDGEIHLLPALPAGWPDGSITGLKARGGFEVGLEWRGGRLLTASVRHPQGAPCKLRHGGQTATVEVAAGEVLHMDAGLRVRP